MSVRKRAIVVQPGKLGDILITSTIAKYYYEKGYEIDWPVFDNFYSAISRFKFVNPIKFDKLLDGNKYYSSKRMSFLEPNANAMAEAFFDSLYEKIDKDQYDLVIDPCFSFPGHSNRENNRKTNEYSMQGKNWIELKFDLTSTPLSQRWNFQYERQPEKEEELLKFIKQFAKKKYGSESYTIVHSYGNLLSLTSLKVNNPINFSFIKGYEIFDWLKVLENSESIVCCDSSLCNFVEVCESLAEKPKFYLGSEEPHYHSYMRNILLNNWTNLTKEDITYAGFKRK
jgi:hypothetical protein